MLFIHPTLQINITIFTLFVMFDLLCQGQVKEVFEQTKKDLKGTPIYVYCFK